MEFMNSMMNSTKTSGGIFDPIPHYEEMVFSK
jgi:hypothetical protein